MRKDLAKIGVFDSGVGGLSVVNAIKLALPEHQVIFRNDQEHLPYGTKNLDQIYKYAQPILKSLVDDGCQIIVIACNTVSTNFAQLLRKELKIPIVAMEPMVKPAALATKTGVITVCATPRTLQSSRYEWLKQTYAKDILVIEPDCSSWTDMIESDQVDEALIKKVVEQSIVSSSDQIVLGCTHYHWIEELIIKLARGRAAVLQPEQAVITQLKKVLSELE